MTHLQMEPPSYPNSRRSMGYRLLELRRDHNLLRGFDVGLALIVDSVVSVAVGAV